MGRAINRCREIMEVFRDTGYKVRNKVSMGDVHNKIGIAVGIDKRTKAQYNLALVEFGFLKNNGNWTFTILKFPGQGAVKHKG